MTRRTKRVSITASTLFVILLSACQPTPQERMTSAEQYIAQGDYRTAGIELRNVLQADPENARARLLLAKSAYQVGDLGTAVSQYERALGLGETDADTWVGLGRSLLGQGRARDAFERVVPNLNGARDYEPALTLIADVLFALQNYAEANSYYLRAAEVSPSSARAKVGIAMVLAAQGDDVQAQEILSSASQEYPESSFVWFALGNFHRSNRDFAAAASAYEKSLSVGSATTPLAEQFSAGVSLVSTQLDSNQADDAAMQLAALQLKFPGHPVLDFLGGSLAFKNGDFEKAQLALQDYLSKNPGDARGDAILGAVNFSQDNLRQAEIYLMNAVRANAGGETTRRLLAETKLRLNNPEEALEALRGMGPLEQMDATYLAMLGRAQIAVGDTAAAIQYFEQSIEEQPDNVPVGLALATAYLKIDNIENAVDLLDTLPQQEGSELRRRTLLIAALAKQGRRDRALEESAQLLRDRPEDASAHVVAGALSQSFGELDRAREHFEQALTFDPESLSALFGLSRMELAADNIGGAEAGLKRLLKSHPTYMPAVVSLGMILQRSGSLAELRGYLETAIDSAPQLLAPRVVLARLELALASPDDSIKVVAAAEERFKDEPELDHVRGLALLAKGDYLAALRSLLAATEADPRNAAFQFDLAQAQLVNELYGEAFATATQFVDLQPEDARGPALVADAAIRMGDPGQAVKYVEAFAETNPEHPDLEVLRGDLDLASRDAASAIAHYDAAAARQWNRAIALRLSRAHSFARSGFAEAPLVRWLREHPEDHDARFTYAQLLEAEGKSQQAKAEYEELLSKGELSAVGMNNLAWQLALEGDERAVPLAEEAHALVPDNGNVTDTLGWILAEKGELERALPLLREAASQSPENPEIKYHFASVLARTGDKQQARTIISELLRSEQQFPSRPDAERLSRAL